MLRINRNLNWNVKCMNRTLDIRTLDVLGMGDLQ